MNTAIFFDTETTGLPDFKAPSEAKHQPHIVQLGACLVDLDTRKTISTLDVIIKPEGWTIPQEVSAIHGITTELAMDVGIPESLAVEMLLEMVKGRIRIAHNEQFDARIIRIAAKRFFSEETCEEWKNGSAQCTAVLSSPILQLPPTERMIKAGFRKHKTPNLTEAYRFFTGRELVNAHSALADVEACRDVFLAIQSGQTTAAALAA